MSDESAEERETRARDLAVAVALRAQKVDDRLASHEARLNAINGSIERHAANAATLAASIEGLRKEIAGIAETQRTHAAVEVDRVNQLKKANDSQISNRMFLAGVVSIIVTILTAFISSGQL